MPTSEELGRLAAAAGLGEASLVLERLGARGWTAAFEAGRPLSPASMIKVPLAVAAAACGLDSSRTVRTGAENMTANDAASPLEPGYVATVEQLVDLMIARSDNVATNVLIDLIGRERATGAVQRLGLHDTWIRRKLSGSEPLIHDPEASGRNAHPAADAATLLRLLAGGAAPGAPRILAALEHQHWNDKLPCGMRAGDRFAHKTGDTDEVSHDGGILRTAEGARYILVVYTALPSSPAADARFAAFMRALRPRL